MPRLIPTSLLHQLQSRPESIRNVCILAHVDHGKTTLADSLIASNGIISSRMAGIQRYMDSRPDEQEKGITMKSSSIALCYKCDEKPFLINLVDSPGHVDFCGEVAAATRLCDGALIIVDVVEGVCPQTHAVLRQAWKEGLRPILVLNKIDRLFTQLQLDPTQALKQLQQVVTEVNAIAGELFLSDILKQEDKNNEPNSEIKQNEEDLFDEEKEEKLYFNPPSGNVVFSSALDGWAFQISDFASLWARKLNVKQSILQKTLWGDYFYDSKLKRIRKGALTKLKKPLFVQMVLENVWAVYQAIINKFGDEKLDKILNSLNVTLMNRDRKHHDARFTLKAVMQQWLPLSAAVLNSVCRCVPPPNHIHIERVKYMFEYEEKHTKYERLFHDICKANPDGKTVLFVSKVIAVEKDMLPENRRNALSQIELSQLRKLALEKQQVNFDSSAIIPTTISYDNDDPVHKYSLDSLIFLAIARVLCGTVRSGMQLHVISDDHVMSDVIVGNMYMLMGREFEEMEEQVTAGNVIGIQGIEDKVVKCATLSSDLDCIPVRSLQLYAEPIVRVSIEPKLPSQMNMLITALKLLDRADPCARVLTANGGGELLLVTAGEVHLNRCIRDLRNTFSGCQLELNVSEPIIPFLETIVNPPKIDQVNEMINKDLALNTAQCVHVTTANKRHGICVRAVPLPDSVVSILKGNEQLICMLDARTKGYEHEKLGSEILEFKKELMKAVELVWRNNRSNSKTFWGSLNLDQALNLIDRIWSFGPKKASNNLLINCVVDYDRPSIWSETVDQKKLREFDHSVLSGFQICCSAGPLCEEPIAAVAFIVQEWDGDCDSHTNDVYGPMSGQIIATVKEGCKQAFQAQPQRLVAAMYSCVIQATSEVLGKVYAVLNRRKAIIVNEDLREGTNLFEIKASLPVVESFGFADDIRKKTSGLASPQLVFSHWQVVEQDPFWVPTTEEELTHFGEKADAYNQANVYLNAIRRRKGLATDDKIVVHAEKQRTLSKKV